MSNKADIDALLQDLRATRNQSLQWDEEAITREYQQGSAHQSLAIKVLSVLGGIFATLVFLGFVFVSGLFNSAIAVIALGGICYLAAIWLARAEGRIVFDALSVSLMLIGLFLIGLKSSAAGMSTSQLCLLYIALALAALVIGRNYTVSFTAVLIVHGSILALIFVHDRYDWIHVYVSVLAIVVTFLMIGEGSFVARPQVISRLYNPVRTALIFAFLSALILVGKKGLVDLSPNLIWISALCFIALIVFLFTTLFDLLDIRETRWKIGIVVFVVLTLLPTVISPAISGALLVVLLSFAVHHRTGFVTGIAFFLYFVGQFYYDLSFTLLVKSGLLFATGLVFLFLYWFTARKL